MTHDFDLLVIAEMNADLILRGDVTPAFGQVEKLIDDATLTIGSSAAIFACGAARLGLRVAIVGKVGDDEFGHFMLREMAARGVDVTGVITDAKLKTGLSVILSRPGGDRAILTYSGTIAALRYEEIDLRLLARARHLHMGSFYMLDSLRPDAPRIFAAAKSTGLTTSIDTNYDPSECWAGGIDAVLEYIDLFLPNETELCAITRQPDWQAGLSALAPRVPMIALKRGVEGALVQWGAQRTAAPSIPVTVVDTTGAGDSFDAGFVYGFLAGWQPERSLRLAVACGSLSTRAAGGTGAQATLAEALAAAGTARE
jgi:sugar/nucleoside kinase (ribokinase family)